MLLLFAIVVADCLKKSCFFPLFTMCVVHELLYTAFPFALKDEFIMHVFPELMLIFANTSFPFGFDARLWGQL